MTNEKAQIIIGNIPVYDDECYSIAEYQEAKAMAMSALSIPKKGEWVFDGFCGNFGYDDRCGCHCSNCNKKIIVDGVYIVGKGYRILERNKPNFCSNCGSDMKGEGSWAMK